MSPRTTPQPADTASVPAPSMTSQTVHGRLAATLAECIGRHGEARMEQDITRLIHAAARGEQGSENALLSTIYQDLVRLARSKLARERTYTDLNAQSLVHEAWMRCAGSLPQDVASRRVFFSYAARAMQSVVIDHVRQRSAQKRGEGVAEVTLPTGYEGEAQAYTDDQVEHLHAAMERLERVDADLHELVRLRYFAGMTIEEVAEVTGASTATVKRRWAMARTILREAMGDHARD